MVVKKKVSKKRKSLKEKMGRSIITEKEKRSSYGYLNLPKGVPVYKALPGTRNIKFDIMPYEVTDKKHPDRDDEFEVAIVGELWYRRPFRIHRNVGANNNTIVCPASIGKKCPICEARAKRTSEGADKEELNTMKSSLRNLYVVIPKGSKDYEEKPHIWDVSNYLFEKLLREEIEEDEDNGCFSDLESGKTLKVRFDSATVGKGKPYAEASRIDFLDREEEYEESILEDILNLDEVLQFKTYKEIENLWFELDEVEEEEEEEEVKPKKKSDHPVNEDEEDEEEEEIDEEDEEEEDEEVDEVDEEEEEEEQSPKQKAHAKAVAAKKKIAAESKKSTPKNKCPFGHRFGIDCEAFDDCDACELWEDCSETLEDE